MRLLTYGEIMDKGRSAFTAAAHALDRRLTLKLTGSVRVENPYSHLTPFLDELKVKLEEEELDEGVIDFTELTYCNSIGFYILMDMIELVFKEIDGMIAVRRLEDDDWQQESLPNLLNLEEDSVKSRTVIEEVREL
jgi:hypothetical protein